MNSKIIGCLKDVQQKFHNVLNKTSFEKKQINTNFVRNNCPNTAKVCILILKINIYKKFKTTK